jgi:hypothetical protein
MSGNAPGWFRIVALIALVWNLFGFAMYLSSVGLFGDPAAGLSDAERAAHESIPALVTAAFAIGTLAGVVGSIGLFLRRRWALPALAVSLAALAVLEGWVVFLSGALEAFGGAALPVTVVLVAALLAWLAYHARGRGWLA